MPDVYEVLSKYFAGASNPEEEIIVTQFKKENPEEYQTLKLFWSNEQIHLTEFDKDEGWKKVKQNAEPAKEVNMYQSLRKVVAIAAVLFVAIACAYILLPTNETAQFVEKIANKQGEKVTLEDGSIVYLNKGATLSYPNSFADLSIRELTLEGEAFFEVQKDPNRPFVIHTPHSKVEVLGTSFNVNNEIDHTQVTVTTGKVKVENLSQSKSSILLPNQTAQISKKNIVVTTTTSQNHLVWKTGVMEFENTPLYKVVQEINTYYGNKIILSVQANDCPLTCSLNQHKLEDVVRIIELSCNLSIEQKNGSYVLR